MKYIYLALLFLSCAANGQEEPTRPATSKDFEGAWRIVLVPNEFQKSSFRNEDMGYSDPCQFFVHNHNNSWLNVSVTNAAGVEESKKRCPTSKASLAPYLIVQDSQQFKWEKMRDGFFYVSESKNPNATKPNGIVWKADKILAKMPYFGIELLKGDMIMQIIRPVNQNRGEAIYALVLRPLSNK